MARSHSQPQEDCGDHIKIFITKDFLETTCSELILHMYDAGYFPDVLAGVRRGGAHAGAYGTGDLQRLEVPHVHYPVTGKSYGEGELNSSHTIEVANMGELTSYIRAFGKKRLCFFDDVIDTGITAHALISIAQNGLRRSDAVAAKVVRNAKEIGIDPDRARVLGPEFYVIYEYPMKADGVSYKVKAHMICDICPVDADVAIVAPFEKSDENKTGVKPRFCEYDFERIDGKRVWLNFPYERSQRDITSEQLMRERPNVAFVHLRNFEAV